VCVVLHEFGHVFAARRYGIRTSDVTLLPIGGVASLERMRRSRSGNRGRARRAAVNLVIALLLMFVLGAQFDLSQMAQLEQAQTTLIGRIAAANVMLFAFNLIPAFPMDGGRVLASTTGNRHGLYARNPRGRLHRPGAGSDLCVLGLMGNPLLVLIAVFIFLAASGEAGYVQMRDYTRGYLASYAMITAYQSLNPASTQTMRATPVAAHDAAGISCHRWGGGDAWGGYARGPDQGSAGEGWRPPVLEFMCETYRRCRKMPALITFSNCYAAGASASSGCCRSPAASRWLQSPRRIWPSW